MAIYDLYVIETTSNGLLIPFTVSASDPVGTLSVEDDDLIFDDDSQVNDSTQNVVGNTIGNIGGQVDIKASTTLTGDDGSTITAYRIAHPESGWTNDSGVYVTTAPLVEGVTYTHSNNNGHAPVPYADLAAGVVCFTRDTMIDTEQGEMAVQDLTPGMMVRTHDNGMQPIRWIGSTKRAAVGKLAPIKIAAGTLGNTRDLRVSPQHRMLLDGWRAELLFGEPEVLAPAKALINDKTIVRDEGGQVEYFHILFDQHEIIFAEGAAAESFHPGEEGWSALDAATRNEILELFPELETDFESYGPSARMSLKAYEAAVLTEFLA